MLCPDQVPFQVKKIGYGCMDGNKSLSLLHRLEPRECRTPHPSLAHPGCFVRLFYTIVLTLFGTVDRLWNQLPMGNTIAPRLVRQDLPGFVTQGMQ